MLNQLSSFRDCSKQQSTHHRELCCRPAVWVRRCAGPLLMSWEVVVPSVPQSPLSLHPIRCWQSLSPRRWSPNLCMTPQHRLQESGMQESHTVYFQTAFRTVTSQRFASGFRPACQVRWRCPGEQDSQLNQRGGADDACCYWLFRTAQFSVGASSFLCNAIHVTQAWTLSRRSCNT